MTFEFGVSPDNLAARLRKMADDIDNGEVLVSSVTDNTRASRDDFEIKHLVVRYHQKKPG